MLPMKAMHLSRRNSKVKGSRAKDRADNIAKDKGSNVKVKVGKIAKDKARAGRTVKAVASKDKDHLVNNSHQNKVMRQSKKGKAQSRKGSNLSKAAAIADLTSETTRATKAVIKEEIAIHLRLLHNHNH